MSLSALPAMKRGQIYFWTRTPSREAGTDPKKDLSPFSRYFLPPSFLAGAAAALASPAGAAALASPGLAPAAGAAAPSAGAAAAPSAGVAAATSAVGSGSSARGGCTVTTTALPLAIDGIVTPDGSGRS